MSSARTIHPFPARMAPEIALRRMAQVRGSRRIRVLDPMCGSGTVLGAALQEGHEVWGFDVDPLAVLISRVAVASIDTTALRNRARKVVEASKRSKARSLPWRDQETRSFAAYWFAEHQQLQLTRLSRSISEVGGAKLRMALQVAMSRIIITKSPKASLAADTSHSRPHRVATSSEYDVLAGFMHSVDTLIPLLEKRDLRGVAHVRQGDARSLPLQSSCIDLVITSPPYLNAIDYMRGHRLSLIWLGFSLGELRAIRSDSVGAERALDEAEDEKTTSMVRLIEASATKQAALPRPVIARYARDLNKFAVELHRVCSRDARVVTVIGNSNLRGNFIRNDALVRRALKSAGFDITSKRSRDLPEASRYLPVRVQDARSSMARRIRTETVLTAVKR